MATTSSINTRRRDYTRIGNGVHHGSNGHIDSDNHTNNNNNTSALARLKKKLQSFENPAYNRLNEDGIYDDLSSVTSSTTTSTTHPPPSRTTSKLLLDSQEDLNLRPLSNPQRRRRQRRKCALVIWVLITVVICLITALTIFFASPAISDKLLTPTNNSNITTSSDVEPVASTTLSTIVIPKGTVFGNLTVTNVLFFQMRVIEGQYSMYEDNYVNSKSAQFQLYEKNLCTAVSQIFGSGSAALATLFDHCTLKALRNGSVLVDLIVQLTNNVTVQPSEQPSTLSIDDIRNMFLHFFETTDSEYYYIFPGQFIVEKISFIISPGILYTTLSTTPSTETGTYMSTTLTPDIQTQHSTVSNDQANCTEKQFLCNTGVITLQHRRSYCIDQNEVCDGYKDCLLGEDEDNCNNVCSNGGFRCRGRDAVDVILKSQCTWTGEECDGVGDCSDQSDEANCTCISTDFRCHNGTDKRNLDFCIPEFYVCDREGDCTDSSDEYNCTYTCEVDQFMCKNSTIARPPFHGYCIEAHEVCDGHMDCMDNSDEMGCNDSCPNSKFRCESTDINDITYCIPYQDKCDRVQDCKNNTDEKNCTYSCDVDMFQCKTGVISRWPYRGFCLYNHERCNGVKECGDNSDEEGCDKIVTCEEDEYRCANGSSVDNGDVCIPNDYLCDRRKDCSDGSDENPNQKCTDTCESGFYKCKQGPVLGTTQFVGRGFCLAGHTRCDGVQNCEDGSDEEGCDLTCGSNLFLCDNGTSTHTTTGHRCIPSGFRCDRDYDCTDGSDEVNCNYTCLPGQWACKTKMLARWPYWGYCIWKPERCDGYFDCEDLSDEDDCQEAVTCSTKQFQCLNGTNIYFDSVCIDNSLVCDRHEQCLDGSDEKACDYNCPDDQFMCNSNNEGQDPCIPQTHLCDGVSHCVDNSDEDKCNATCTPDQFTCVDGHDRRTGSRCIDKKLQCDRVIDCTDNSDEPMSCQYICEQGFFTCVTGVLSDKIESGEERRGFCLPPHLICDHTEHCEDGSDENDIGCQQICKHDRFRCVNGTSKLSGERCIPKPYRCDRQEDCTDKSDEIGCDYDACTEEQWICATGIIKNWPRQGYCIDKNERCDGEHDCEDLSDELGCNGTNCDHEKGKSFVCVNGADKVMKDACIPARQQCDRVSDCTDDSDETNCTYRCPNGLVKCPTGIINRYPYRGFCVYHREVCDGIRHCVDGSDESACDGITCGNDEFKCKAKNGSIHDGERCITAKWRCDRVNDCADGSDEEDCVYDCTDEEFQCKNGTIYRWPYYGFCIAKRDVCDGYKDCDDMSDEADELCNPETLSCPHNTFRCQNETIAKNQKKACIPSSQRCNGIYECSDHSDESGCNYTCKVNQVMCRSSANQNNGGLPECIEKKQKCDGIIHCADGSDEQSCGNHCTGSDSSFRCVSGLDVNSTTACIDSMRRCDNIRDCQDGSDEKECENINNTCSESEFKCPTKPIWYFTHNAHWCLEKPYVCDKFVDCGDYADEMHCNYTCSENHFQCGFKNNTLGAICIPYSNVCNGETDCHTGADEDADMCSINNCERPDVLPCYKGGVSIHNGQACVSLESRCNGIRDCSDGSDENNC